MIGHGAILSGSTAGTIGKITNADWSGLVVEDVEITDFDSPEKYREFEAGLRDGGELTADLKFDATLASTVRDAEGVTQTWTLTLNDTSTVLLFAGYLKGLSLGVPIGDQISMPVAFKITGRPHFPSSSSSSSSSSST